MINIYSDGSCYPNPGPGGWGAVLIDEEDRKEIHGSDPATTISRMELMAAIQALECLVIPCEVRLYTDSQYVQKGMREWSLGWMINGWHTHNGDKVANADLWQRLLRAAKLHKVEWIWIRGHSGNPENERADRLALLGRTIAEQQLDND
jgi:ribonuclease HI